MTYQEEQGPRAGGAPLTPRSEREAVLIYRSVLDTVRDAETPEEGNRILRDLLEVSFGEKQLQDVPNPNRMIIRPMLVSLDKAAERHDRSVDAGGSGGRPRLELDREALEQDYAELGSWEKVAEKHGVSKRTLYRERERWRDEVPKCQNLTKTNTDTKTNTKTNTLTKTKTTARPSGRSGARSARGREQEKKAEEPMRNDLERAILVLHEGKEALERRSLERIRREREAAARAAEQAER